MKVSRDVRARGELPGDAVRVIDSGGGLEPVRLLEGGGSPFERRLLESARVDHMPRVSRAQLARTLQVPGAHGLAGRLRELLGASRLARYGACVGLGGLALLGGWAASTQRPPGAERTPSVALATPAQFDRHLREQSVEAIGPATQAHDLAARDTAASALSTAAAHEPLPSESPNGPSPASATAVHELRQGAKPRPHLRAGGAARATAPRTVPAPNGLGEELHALETAQALLRAGRSSEAQRALADYARRFPAGELALEAQLLSIDVMVARGDSQRARERARLLLASPEAARYRGRLDAIVSTAQKDGTPPESASALAPHGPMEATQ